MTPRLIRLARLPAAERSALIDAVWSLSAAAVALRLLSFRRLAPRLGRHMAESPEALDGARTATARLVRWAVESAARHVPWSPTCFPQAVAAQWMLRRRGVESTLYLGLDAEAGYEAHAWVRAGTTIVTGGPRRGHTVVSSFA